MRRMDDARDMFELMRYDAGAKRMTMSCSPAGRIAPRNVQFARNSFRDSPEELSAKVNIHPSG